MPKLFSWNPRPYLFQGRIRRVLPIKSRHRVNNFGDLLGPIISRYMISLKQIPPDSTSGSDVTLFSIGSVLHFAQNGDVVWGAGRNGKIDADAHHFQQLDVRAVRGPLTRSFLAERGIDSPAIYGDPGLLVPEVFPHLPALAATPRTPVAIVPNLNDLENYERSSNLIDPRAPLLTVLEQIASAEMVVGSSLHGIIVAESLGIPARLIVSEAESSFKYEDYYLGSGRNSYEPAADVHEAIEMGGEPRAAADLESLKRAFPYDAWG